MKDLLYYINNDREIINNKLVEIKNTINNAKNNSNDLNVLQYYQKLNVNINTIQNTVNKLLNNYDKYDVSQLKDMDDNEKKIAKDYYELLLKNILKHISSNDLSEGIIEHYIDNINLLKSDLLKTNTIIFTPVSEPEPEPEPEAEPEPEIKESIKTKEFILNNEIYNNSMEFLDKKDEYNTFTLSKTIMLFYDIIKKITELIDIFYIESIISNIDKSFASKITKYLYIDDTNDILGYLSKNSFNAQAFLNVTNKVIIKNLVKADKIKDTKSKFKSIDWIYYLICTINNDTDSHFIKDEEKFNNNFNKDNKFIDLFMPIMLSYTSNIKEDYDYIKKIINKEKKMIDKLILRSNTDHIITCLKIRNNNPGISYNKRFEVRVLDNTVNIKYNYDNEEYYTKNDQLSQYILDSSSNNAEKKLFNVNSKKDFEVINYDKSYYYGQFNSIFDTIDTNRDIAKKMKDVQNKLIQGKNILIIGYGASGSGKTSTLVYYNRQNEDGIALELCNLLHDKYNQLEVCSYELFKDYLSNNEDKVIRNPEDKKNTFKFIYDESKGQFLLNLDRFDKMKYINKHTYRSGNETYFNNKEPLGNILVHFIENDRYVKATTNNPNSSRSHSLIFIKLIGKHGGLSPYLIIGDFAGVENEFDCKNSDILKMFSSIKNKDNQYFYPNEVKNYSIDPSPLSDIRNDISSTEICFNNLKTQRDIDIHKIKGIAPEVALLMEKIMTYVFEEHGGFDNILIKNPDELLDILNKNERDINKIIPFLIKNKNNNIDEKSMLANSGIDKNYIDKFIKFYEFNDKYAIVLPPTISTNDPPNTPSVKDFKNKIADGSHYTFIKGTKLRERIDNYENLIKSIRNNTTKKVSEIFTRDNTIFLLYDKKAKTLKLIQGNYNNVTVGNYKVISNVDNNINIDNFTILIQNPKDNNISAFNNYESYLQQFYNEYLDFKTYDTQKIINKYVKIKETITDKIDFTKFNVNIESVYNQLKSIISEINCKLKSALNICTNRVIEGKFINKSLLDLRTDISNKLKSIKPSLITRIPHIKCREDYCNANKKCMELPNVIEKKVFTPTSLIFNIIKKEIESIDIIICIFNVINISRDYNTNNPPTVPFIDINNIKKIINYKNPNEISSNDLKKALEVSLNDIKNFGKKTEGLTLVKISRNSEETMIDYINRILSSNFKVTSQIINNINMYINMIEQHNAASTIGTMEFLDRLAKFNTTSISCTIEDDNDENYQIVY